jgi:hypothetical protein
MSTMYTKWTCILALLGAPALGWAEPASNEAGESHEQAVSVDDIALELSSPASRLLSLGWDFEYRTYQGDLPEADEQTGISNIFTLSWPIQLRSGKTLQLRTTIPVLGDQPYWKPVWYLDYTEVTLRAVPDLDPTVGEFSPGHDHLQDVGLDFGISDVNESGFISYWGIANVLPTSEDLSAERGQWLLGPDLAFGQITDWGLYGVRFRHLTSVTGEGNHEVENLDTNETTLELFYTYALGNGWQIESNPVVLYDWEAVSGNEWTVPIGAGASKTVMLGRVPMKLAFDLQYFVVSPDRLGPEWLFRMALTPVFSSKLLQ